MQHLTIRRLAALLLATIFLSLQGLCHIVAQTKFDYEAVDHCSNVFIVNDMGRNGYYDQKPIAELMGTMAEQGADPECILALGDVHHFNGVQSVQDPLWLTNFELIYSHPELMLDWFPILGNHEYRGNTQAVLDYAQVSRRWVMPARYYTHVVEGHGTQIRIIMLDTTPLISKYRKDSQTYPDAVKQDDEAQLRWLDKTLSEATEQWVVVVGHHPVYAQTPKAEDERTTCRNVWVPFWSAMPTSICTSVGISIISNTSSLRARMFTMLSTQLPPLREKSRPSTAPFSAALNLVSPSSRQTRVA